MNEKLQSILNALPHGPGIYLMKDAQGTILYVGKALSLYHRVRSYFQTSTDLSPKNRCMVAQIEDIEFLVVRNEVEALVLESNYIKQYRPKYNVLLRDDKHYPYIKVALTEDFPRVYRVRSFQHDGNRYFGPYTHSGAVDTTLDLLNKLFPFRTCRYDASSWAPSRDGEPPAGWKQKLLSRPCTQYSIHRCTAPCVAYTTRQEYDAMIKQVILFLEGKHDEVIKDLQAQMEQAAEMLNFEEAGRLRDRMQAVKRILEKQRIINTESQNDQDVVALASGDDETCAQVFFFRMGKLIGREFFMLQGTRDSSPGEIMASFLQQFYASATHIPAELIVEVEPDDSPIVLGWLRERRKALSSTGQSSTVTLITPKRGDKVRLVEMVKQNAREVLEQQRIKWLTDNQKTQMALGELQEVLNLATTPRRIECYDISNTQGTNSVGAMVVFENGKAKNNEYRRFKIKQVDGANDVASHQEVLRRRFRKVNSSSALTTTRDDEQIAEIQGAASPLPEGSASHFFAKAEQIAEIQGATSPLPGGSASHFFAKAEQIAEIQGATSPLPGGSASHFFAKAEQIAGMQGAASPLTGGPGAVPPISPPSAAAGGERETHEELQWSLPDLIILDGGRAQLNAGLEVLNELKLEIPIIGLAKEEGSHTKLATGEQIFLPQNPGPLLLPRNSQGLYLLQRIRDEAHRFGITYHRSMRNKRTLTSLLDEIPGIGPKRKKVLMKHFGSLRAISAASIDELAALDGMTRDAATLVKEYLGRME